MKLFVLKKSAAITLLIIILCGAACGVIAGVTATAYSPSPNAKVIVIDAGHGGVDAGVRGIDSGEKESDINLAIARELRGKFTEAGFKVVMTRTTEGGLYGTSAKGFKMRDMKKRKEIIEESGAQMVISIHQNFCPIPSRRGAQVFYDKDSDCGKELALCVQNSLNNMEECVKKSSPLVGDYYMLKCTQNPSVIVECGFLSNSLDEKLLRDKNYHKKLAEAIFYGAVSFYA